MPRTNKPLVNMVGGELSPLMTARVDLPIFQKGLARCENFICLPQGGSRFRNGTQFVKYTRLNQKAAFIPFQFNDTQAYLIEATKNKFRFYKDNSAVTETSIALTTATTNANPGILTTTSAHGYSVGDEVFITGMTGMTRLNNRFFLVNSTPSATTLSLKDIVTGTAIDTTTYGAHTLNTGTIARVYEITTPYAEVDVEGLSFAQNADTMYIAHRNYPPGKLTRTGHAAWTLNNAYTRTTDPFVGTTKTITGVTQANPAVVTTSAAHTLAVGDIVGITGVVGMTQLNGLYYRVKAVPTTTTFSLQTVDSVDVDSTAYGAWSSGGTVTLSDKFPRAVQFTDTGRLCFGGSKTNPEALWFSQAPTVAGVNNYDVYTTGSNPTDALIFNLAPVNGRVDAIQWIANTAKALLIGTFGSIRRMHGATEQEPLSATSVNSKSINGLGVAYTLPVSNGDVFFYVQRITTILRSLGYDISNDGYSTTDRNLVADHITKSGIKQVVEQQGQPDVVWGARNDGRFIGLTFKEKEDISGWHRHFVGGTHVNSSGITVSNAKVLWCARMARPAATDQLWMVVERRINSATVRCVEYMNDPPVFPVLSDFFTGEDNEDSDKQKFRDALFEVQKDSIHVDMNTTYDGSAQSTATMTPGATTGTGVTFTAGASFFTSAMVGRQIWKKYDSNGDGGGRAQITAYTSPTQVTCTILSAFDSTTAIAAGSWFITASSVSGLDHLIGETVHPIADGGPHNAVVVDATGTVTLEKQCSKVHVGYKYRGVIETLNIDSGGASGSAMDKTRNIIKAVFRVLNSLGIKFGSDYYNLTQIVDRNSAGQQNRPPQLRTESIEQTYSDSWESQNKRLVMVQDYPVPCTVLGIDVFLDTSDE